MKACWPAHYVVSGLKYESRYHRQVDRSAAIHDMAGSADLREYNFLPRAAKSGTYCFGCDDGVWIQERKCFPANVGAADLSHSLHQCWLKSTVVVRYIAARENRRC